VIGTGETSSRARNRGLAVRVLFPPIRVRFSIALLLIFFPLGILYPLDYPLGELLTLCCSLWVFPSPLGWLLFGLVPLIPTGIYGYFAFNLFCFSTTLAIAASAFRSRELTVRELPYLHRFVRGCMIVTLAIAAIQAVTDQYLWMSIFSNIRLEPGRGAGLKCEPSQLGSLLALYLVLLAGRIENARATPEPPAVQRLLRREGTWIILATLALTRSFTVTIVAACFVPVLFLRRKHLTMTVSAVMAGAVVGVTFMGERISVAFQTSGGSLTELITGSVSSWRNIPDVLILTNYRDCLFPGNPSEVRLKINTLAVLMSPALVWIQNTFSSFSAGAVTIGLLATSGLLLAGLATGLKKLPCSPSMRASWLMTYLAAWFFIAKWDPAAWIAVGLLPLIYNLNPRSG